MRLAFYASMEHYIDHLAPVWKALGAGERTSFFTVPTLVPYAESIGVAAEPLPAWPKIRELIAVSAEGNRRQLGGRPVVRFEHGIGGSFGGLPPDGRVITGASLNPSYAGGRGQANVKLFCNANHYPNDRWLAAYPKTPSEIVGTPKMDAWHNAPPKPQSDPPVVCVSFHFEATVCSEARSAFPHFRSGVAELAKRRDIELVGHAHPKGRKQLRPFFEKLGVLFIERFDEVLEVADLYAIDHMSTLYEFASLDRPVVVLNAPWYRRYVHHGLRFWEHSDVGVNCDRSDDLCAAVDRALEDPPAVRKARRATTKDLYPFRGHAAEQAVKVLREFAKRKSA